MPKAQRRTEISLAVSEYTGTKWLPRRVSQRRSAHAVRTESLDRTADLLLSVTPDPDFTIDVYLVMSAGRQFRIGSFLLTGCKGYPEVVPAWPVCSHLPSPVLGHARCAASAWSSRTRIAGDQLALTSLFSGTSFQTLFGRTPGIFRARYPFQASEIDRLLTRLCITGQARAVISPTRCIRHFDAVLLRGQPPRLCAHTGLLRRRLFGHGKTRTTIKTFSNVRHLIVDVVALWS